MSSESSADNRPAPARTRITRKLHPESSPDEGAFADLIFDPATEWFSDVPLVRVSEDGNITVVRGTLTDRERAETARQRPAGTDGQTVGVLTNALGAVTLARVGEVFYNDPRDVHALARDGLLWGGDIDEVIAGLRAALALLERARAAGFDVMAQSNGESGLSLTDAPDRVSDVGGYDPPWPDFARGADPAMYGSPRERREPWAPPPRPTAAETKQAMALALAQRDLIDEFGLHPVAELDDDGCDTTGWLVQRRLFTVPGPHGGRVPGFALTDDRTPRALLADILTALDGALQGWELALWFTGASASLGGVRPVDVLTSAYATDADRQALLAAATAAVAEVSPPASQPPNTTP